MNRESLKKHLSETKYDTTILKFTASWCGPCKTIAPAIKALKEHYIDKNFEYIEIDIDNSIDLYSFFKKQKMLNGIPTVMSFKKREYTPETYWVPFKAFTGASPNDVATFFKLSLEN